MDKKMTWHNFEIPFRPIHKRLIIGLDQQNIFPQKKKFQNLHNLDFANGTCYRRGWLTTDPEVPALEWAAPGCPKGGGWLVGELIWELPPLP